MILWIPDPTGRFRQRPYFLLEDLDRRCERVITRFTTSLYGFPATPVPTGALLKLLMRDAIELNHYADLRGEGDGVEGVTYFSLGQKPPDGFDWMEWQAGYTGAAFLMPRTSLHRTVLQYFRGREIRRVPTDSPQARDLQQLVSEAFFVSEDAARVRLSQTGYFAD